MTDESRKPKRERSPTYPAVDLGTAVRRAGELQSQEGFHWAPVAAVLQAWNYTPKSSNGLLTIAALKRYGLIEDRGANESREARLTDFARAILLDEREDSPDRLKRLQEAALMPRINGDIWEKYGGTLPSDATLRYHLTVESGFTPSGAEDFLRQFRRTIEFARLTADPDTVSPSGSVSESVADSGSERSGVFEYATSPRSLGRIEPSSVIAPSNSPPPIQFPVVGATIVVQTSDPLTEEGWDQMMAVLGALKPAIVQQTPRAPVVVYRTITEDIAGPPPAEDTDNESPEQAS